MSVKICTLNACGWSRKRDLIRNMANSDDVDILAITETRTTAPRIISLPGFTVHQHNSPTHRGIYGTAIAVRTHLPQSLFQLPPFLDHLECCAVLVHLTDITITVIVYYNPPSEALNNDLFIYAASLRHCVLLGDFNARHTDFRDTHTNPNGRFLSNLLQANPIVRLRNSRPTLLSHLGSSIVDHILVSENLAARTSRCTIGTCVTSDHLPLSTKLQTTHRRQQNVTPRTIRNFKAADWTLINATVSPTLLDGAVAPNPAAIDAAVDLFTTSIQTALDVHVPAKTVHHNRLELPPNIISLIRSKRRLYRRYLRTRDPLIKTEWNRQNAFIRRTIIVFKEHTWTEACNALDYRKGKAFWSQFNQLTQRKPPSTPAQLLDNATPTTNRDRIAEIFADSLQGIYTTADGPDFNDRHRTRIDNYIHTLPHPRHDETDLLDPTSLDEVRAIINTGRNSAPGEDTINRFILRQLDDTCITFLTNILNACLLNSYFPARWKYALTVMIHKSNKNPLLPTSYRPISLLDAGGKVLERIIANRLLFFLDEHRIIPDSQCGFRKDFSTQHAITSLQTDVSKNFNHSRCTLAVFMDIQRAFDSVWHNGLLYKLHNIGLSTATTRFFQSYLLDRTFRIKISDVTSSSRPIQAGVPQGAILSPILYSIYCHDIPQPTTFDSTLSQYADDTAYWTSGFTTASCSRKMQTELLRYERWLRTWRITPNTAKTQTILFRHPNHHHRRGQHHRNIHLRLWNDRLHLSDTAKYLGVSFDRRLNWSSELRIVRQRTTQRLNLLKRVRGGLRGCSSATLLHTYKTFIRPIFDYRATIYKSLHPIHLRRLLATERRIIRLIYRLHFRHPSVETTQLADIEPIDERLHRLLGNSGRKKIVNNHLPSIRLLSIRSGIRDRNILPRKPKRKFKHPPAIILSAASDIQPLPDHLTDILDTTPLVVR